VQDNTNVIITGVAGIGKSEFIRAYIQKYKSQYANIGYYFYNGDLKSIIANINRSPLNMDTDIDSRYQTNLELDCTTHLPYCKYI
jgi:adenylate kinase